jgi:hypothetical protein
MTYYRVEKLRLPIPAIGKSNSKQRALVAKIDGRIDTASWLCEGCKAARLDKQLSRQSVNDHSYKKDST